MGHSAAALPCVQRQAALQGPFLRRAGLSRTGGETGFGISLRRAREEVSRHPEIHLRGPERSQRVREAADAQTQERRSGRILLGLVQPDDKGPPQPVFVLHVGQCRGVSAGFRARSRGAPASGSECPERAVRRRTGEAAAIYSPETGRPRDRDGGGAARREHAYSGAQFHSAGDSRHKRDHGISYELRGLVVADERPRRPSDASAREGRTLVFLPRDGMVDIRRQRVPCRDDPGGRGGGFGLAQGCRLLHQRGAAGVYSAFPQCVPCGGEASGSRGS